MNDKQIDVSFTHGLGDCVHFALLLQLYREAGNQVRLHGQSNKQWLWRAAGVEFTDAEGGANHPWGYPGNFEHLDAPDHEANKIAFNINRSSMPTLPGSRAQLWNQLCDVRLSGSPHIRPAVHAEAERFIAGLPRPLVAIHSRGTTWSKRKDIADVECFGLIRLLLDRGYGVIVLDWDARAPMVSHPNCRSIIPTWCMIDQEQQCALFDRLDLLIGIDSGPFHLASLSDVPALGVFRDIQPWRCCIPNPRATYLVRAEHHARMLARRDRWNFWTYAGAEPTAHQIAEAATMILSAQAPVSVTDASEVPGRYVYTRLGYDWRPMELLPNGTIGDGAGGAERRWRVVRLGGEERLLIEGDSGVIAVLTRDWDQIWRGHWTKFECMPIDLAPLREPQGPDAPQARTRGDGMYWLVDDQIPESGIGLQNHEDWMWQHIPTGRDVVIGTAWKLLFSRYFRPDFTRRELIDFVAAFAEKESLKVADNVLARDVDCLIRTYAATLNGKKSLNPEETFDCPLLQLNLIQPSPDGELFRFAIGPKPSLPAPIFAFALAQYFDRVAASTNTLNVQKCLYGEGSPGQAFKLDENSLIEYVEELEDSTGRAMILDETAGLKQIYRRRKFDPVTVLEDYYRGGRRT